MILVGTAVTIFLMTKVYFMPSPSVSEVQSTDANGVVPVTQDDRLRGNVGSANAVVEQQNANNVEANKMLNNL